PLLDPDQACCFLTRQPGTTPDLEEPLTEHPRLADGEPAGARRVARRRGPGAADAGGRAIPSVGARLSPGAAGGAHLGRPRGGARRAAGACRRGAQLSADRAGAMMRTGRSMKVYSDPISS